MKQVIQNLRNGLPKVEAVPAPPVSEGRVLVANRFSLISPGPERSTVQVAQKTCSAAFKPSFRHVRFRC